MRESEWSIPLWMAFRKLQPFRVITPSSSALTAGVRYRFINMSERVDRQLGRGHVERGCPSAAPATSVLSDPTLSFEQKRDVAADCTCRANSVSPGLKPGRQKPTRQWGRADTSMGRADTSAPLRPARPRGGCGGERGSGGVLARAVQQSAGTIRLHAFTFASNHFHLLVWGTGDSARLLHAVPARQPVQEGREAGGLGRQFLGEPLLGRASAGRRGAGVDRLRYVLAHGVKEGLRHPLTYICASASDDSGRIWPPSTMSV